MLDIYLYMETSLTRHISISAFTDEYRYSSFSSVHHHHVAENFIHSLTLEEVDDLLVEINICHSLNFFQQLNITVTVMQYSFERLCFVKHLAFTICF